MPSKKFGYERVSTKDQNEARQRESLLQMGIDERDIYTDKQSGKNFDRPRYQLLKEILREGDILYVHSLDRFGRNKEEILSEWRELTKEKGVDIVVLDMPLLDTTKNKDNLGSLIADLVLQILSWMAEEEREKIRTRQREGIDIALKKGVKFGRPKNPIPENFGEVYAAWKNGEITATKAMKQLNIKKNAFYKFVKEYEKDNIIEKSRLENVQ
ncbi:recombinase family protein [Bacillus sp. V3B]|uniref:recombinase family protein n=1 Tax=Bacillus sp. V3B TaxID=2804915 RepID=UPI002109C863|nr:recombinase family protein [Bacillus sp. V3B]MCQ6275929.1 recombinase family protein [Bacillus sp. V3B]